MKILVNLEDTEKFEEVEIEESSSVFELKMFLQTIFNIPYYEMQLKLNNQIINDPNFPIKDLSIGSNVLYIKHVPSQTITSSQIFQPQFPQNQNFGNNSLGSMFDQFMSGVNNPGRQNFQQPMSIAQQFSLAMQNLNEKRKDLLIENGNKKIDKD